jgi:hypothetical protein
MNSVHEWVTEARLPRSCSISYRAVRRRASDSDKNLPPLIHQPFEMSMSCFEDDTTIHWKFAG